MPAVIVLSVNEYLVGQRWQSCTIVDMAAGLYALILLFIPLYILLIFQSLRGFFKARYMLVCGSSTLDDDHMFSQSTSLQLRIARTSRLMSDAGSGVHHQHTVAHNHRMDSVVHM